MEAVPAKGEKSKRNEYLDPKGYWIDPARNIRRLGKKDGEQLVMFRATPKCSDAEWDRLRTEYEHHHSSTPKKFGGFRRDSALLCKSLNSDRHCLSPVNKWRYIFNERRICSRDW
jgi:hypothetical protein